jgi:glucose/arabinose dehydrogenase
MLKTIAQIFLVALLTGNSARATDTTGYRSDIRNPQSDPAFAGLRFAQHPQSAIRNPQSDILSLPAGFSATILADTLGRARHLAVAPNGDVYVKLEKLKDGKGIYRLRDRNGDGRAEDITGFGNYIGTGIAIRDNYLYASSNSAVYRYAMKNGEVAADAKPELLVDGLVDKRQHASKSLALDNAGNIYVNIGAPSNVCQEKDRAKGSPGMNPCPILDSAGGIWMFRTDKTGQSYHNGVRYATGLRNVVGLDWNSQVNDLYVMQHGRDMLFQYWPELFSQKDGAESPAEEFFRVKKGSDCGWPYCYYDNAKKQKLLNPEYGGDRSKTGPCDGKEKSIMQFPGHLAPNALLFYTGNQFPEKYRNGAFIAFHGSWNRSPEPQEGYYVVFVPMKDGMPSGNWEVFADGFAGPSREPGKAEFRPTGLAQGPDGSIYVSDDQKGRIWKISYRK